MCLQCLLLQLFTFVIGANWDTAIGKNMKRHALFREQFEKLIAGYLEIDPALIVTAEPAMPYPYPMDEYGVRRIYIQLNVTAPDGRASALPYPHKIDMGLVWLFGYRGEQAMAYHFSFIEEWDISVVGCPVVDIMHVEQPTSYDELMTAQPYARMLSESDDAFHADSDDDVCNCEEDDAREQDYQDNDDNELEVATARALLDDADNTGDSTPVDWPTVTPYKGQKLGYKEQKRGKRQQEEGYKAQEEGQKPQKYPQKNANRKCMSSPELERSPSPTRKSPKRPASRKGAPSPKIQKSPQCAPPPRCPETCAPVPPECKPICTMVKQVSGTKQCTVSWFAVATHFQRHLRHMVGSLTFLSCISSNRGHCSCYALK